MVKFAMLAAISSERNLSEWRLRARRRRTARFCGRGNGIIYLPREKGLERKLERNGEVAGNG